MYSGGPRRGGGAPKARPGPLAGDRGQGAGGKEEQERVGPAWTPGGGSSQGVLKAGVETSGGVRWVGSSEIKCCVMGSKPQMPRLSGRGAF